MTSSVSSNQPTPRHEFLKALKSCPPGTKTKDIEQIAKNVLNKWFVYDVEKTILDSVEVLTTDLLKMDSIQEVHEEIAGAVNALSILLSLAESQTVQARLQGELRKLGEFKINAEDIFLLKELGKDIPAKELVINSPRFIRSWSLLCGIYGRDRAHDLKEFLHIMVKLSYLPSPSKALTDFLENVRQARTANLTAVANGRVPSLGDECNAKMQSSKQSLFNAIQSCELTEEETQAFERIIGCLAHDRTGVITTSLYQDVLGLAFNNEGSDPQAKRLLLSRESAKKPGNLNLLETSQGQLEGKNWPDVETRLTIEREIKRVQVLSDFRPRPAGRLLEKARWIPSISPQDTVPLKIDLLVALATPEGVIRESTIRLNFAQAVGQESLPLTARERYLFSRLLKEADLMLQADLQGLETTKRLPPKIASIFNDFTHQDCPCLSQLSPDQKQALLAEAVRFTKEVNFHMVDNLLKLTK